MTVSAGDIDRDRKRWRRVRRRLLLVDPLVEDFGTGGLAHHAPDVHVRFVILPADPDAVVVDFDEPFWEWWMQDRPNPFEGAPATNWGRDSLPAATGAVRFNRWTDDRWNWDAYLAMLRSGGLEFGLGRSGSAQWRRAPEQDPTRVFFLTTIVGRIWVALGLYAEALDRFGIQGPWEITLGLRNSQLAALGNVGAGWAEPERTFPGEQIHRCPDPGVLIIREMLDWPDSGGQRSLAFDIGANIEDAFGCRQRRFLARVDPGAGAFDSSRYRYES